MAERIPENVLQKLQDIAAQYSDLSARLLDSDVLADHRQVRTLSIKRAAIAPIVELYEAYSEAESQIAELEELVASGDDADLMPIKAVAAIMDGDGAEVQAATEANLTHGINNLMTKLSELAPPRTIRKGESMSEFS